MEKQLGWVHKLGGAESLGISKAGQTVLARLMGSQIWHQLTGSVREGFRKGMMASALLDGLSSTTCHQGSSATLVLELKGSESE